MTEALLVPLLVALVALAAGTLAAVAGFVGAVVLLPAPVWAVGVRDAVPILTVAQLVGNGARVWFNRRELDLRVAGWFALGAVPPAALNRSAGETCRVGIVSFPPGIGLRGRAVDERHHRWAGALGARAAPDA